MSNHYIKVGDTLVKYDAKVGDIFTEISPGSGKYVIINTPEQLAEKRRAHLAKQREYYYANKDTRKKYEEEHREEIREKKKIYRESHKEEINERRRKHYERKKTQSIETLSKIL